jgi:hypothetical protein
MSYSEEFQTVDLIINPLAKTRGVDTFALALINAGRQLRKLVSHFIQKWATLERDSRRNRP